MSEAKRWKHGDLRDDGKVFWGYNPNSRNGEYWVTPEKFEAHRAANREKAAAYYAANKAAYQARRAAHRSKPS